MHYIEKKMQNVHISRLFNFVLTVLIMYILKTKDYAFSFDSMLPYVFFIFIFSLLEYRKEITPPLSSISQIFRVKSLVLNILVVVILYRFYTSYELSIHGIVWLGWVTLMLFLIEAIIPFRNISKVYIVGSVLLAALYSVGCANNGYDGPWIRMICKALLLAFCWFFLFLRCFLLIERLLETYRKADLTRNKTNIFSVFFLCLLINFLMCIPFFLVRYPGVLTGDSVHQMAQILGQEPYSNHHPWYYTMMIGVLFRIGQSLTGSVNCGIAAYTLFSMLFMATCFAAAITFLYYRQISAFWLFVLEIIYALDPIKEQYSITMWKDVIFSGCLLVFCIWIANFKANAKWHVGLCVFGILTCLTRNNGIYVLLLFGLIQIACWKKERFALCNSYIVMLLIYTFLTKIVMPGAGVQETEAVESWSIPLQQIAFAVCAEGDISEEEYNLINAVVSTEEIKKEYVEWKSDYIKNIVSPKENIIVENKIQYLKLWATIGMKNPYCYFRAWFEQTKGYWYHKIEYWICIEDGASGEVLGMSKHSLLPEGVSNRIREYFFDCIYEYYPTFYSLGLQTYICIFIFILLIKNKGQWYSVVPILLNILTLLIATPVHAEFRYAYSAYCFIPFGVGLLFAPQVVHEI